MPDNLEKLIDTVRSSKKYQHIAADFVARLAARELHAQPNLKAAIKSTKNKLHQTAAVYQNRMRYDDWLHQLQTTDDPQSTCRDILPAHTSTAERVPILDEFFATCLAELAPVHSVLDIACGLNPLAVPWMPLAEGATYHAYDIFDDLAAFLNQALPLLGVGGHAHSLDIGQHIPRQDAQVALILKTLPCLEQVDKSISLRLMEQLNTPYLLVSFPVRSIGGRQKGMATHYDAHFRALLAEKPWRIQRFDFDTELAYLVHKS